jgi:hypothetical protein
MSVRMKRREFITLVSGGAMCPLAARTTERDRKPDKTRYRAS